MNLVGCFKLPAPVIGQELVQPRMATSFDIDWSIAKRYPAETINMSHYGVLSLWKKLKRLMTSQFVIDRTKGYS